MLHRMILAVALLTARGAAAEEPSVSVHYDGYARGLNVLELDATLSLQPTAYRLKISYRLVGVVGTLVHGDGTSVVDGRFAGGHAVPRELYSAGHLRGVARATQIDWQDGSPKLTLLVPPSEGERDLVPESDQLHTIDTLSAMAALLRQVADTGRCDGASRTFDGRRLSEIAAHTVGEETLEETGRSSFQGRTLRCDFGGRQIAGFLRSEDQDELRRPQSGSVWFARLQPAQPLIPVRITFTARVLGDTTLYLREPP